LGCGGAGRVQSEAVGVVASLVAHAAEAGFHAQADAVALKKELIYFLENINLGD